MLRVQGVHLLEYIVSCTHITLSESDNILKPAHRVKRKKKYHNQFRFKLKGRLMRLQVPLPRPRPILVRGEES